MNKRLLVAALVVSAVTLVLAIWPGQAASSGRCRPVNGHLEERQLPGPGFAATGRLTGGIQGTDTFTLLSLSPTSPSTPTVSHFVGQSVFQTETGDLQLTVAGAFDTVTGKFSDLLTITGGTGEWTGAAGQIHLIGVFDLQAGIGASDYRGEVCFP